MVAGIKPHEHDMNATELLIDLMWDHNNVRSHVTYRLLFHENVGIADHEPAPRFEMLRLPCAHTYDCWHGKPHQTRRHFRNFGVAVSRLGDTRLIDPRDLALAE